MRQQARFCPCGCGWKYGFWHVRNQHVGTWLKGQLYQFLTMNITKPTRISDPSPQPSPTRPSWSLAKLANSARTRTCQNRHKKICRLFSADFQLIFFHPMKLTKTAIPTTLALQKKHVGLTRYLPVENAVHTTFLVTSYRTSNTPQNNGKE